MSAQRLPLRSEVDPADCWDLASLFPSDEAWEQEFSRWEAQIDGYRRFQGKLAKSVRQLARALAFDNEFERTAERLGTYAYLKTAEDTTNSTYQRMQGRFQNASTRAAAAASFMRPEILAVPDETMRAWLESRELAPYRLQLERLLRYKPHTLSEPEERLLAQQSEVAETARQVFRQLHNADLTFGTVTDERGRRVPLTHASFSLLLQSPERRVREAAFRQYYQQFAAHRHTLAATLHGSVQRDVFYAQARRYPSALHAALFPDQVPVTVYDNLIAAVRGALDSLHRYYDLRRRALKLRQIHHYDTYVPLVPGLRTYYPWDKAVELVVAALAPLGSEYTSTLRQGLLARWCDRYENVGKQSGAFSAGTYDGAPYILMNYQPRVLDHVFTLAHEAGHSMHSWYSARSQPFQYYDYSIFVAEVASTFNEQLLGRYLLQRATTDRQRAYLITREIDDIRATIFRQTMFAEFERQIHALVEQHEPLTIERLRSVYRELLEAYFGPRFTLDEELELECLRIPHFYRAFYVYKYATGMSAAIALVNRVLEGGQAELDAYLGFLRGGSSRDPLDLLRDAGVDMERPEPVQAALEYFDRRVNELAQLL
ncbi:MAG: oligoendopeptidase F [Pirellulales bacterium]|nr:oligoendopeptidase F [Pirellulales bacterium]